MVCVSFAIQKHPDLAGDATKCLSVHAVEAARTVAGFDGLREFGSREKRASKSATASLGLLRQHYTLVNLDRQGF
jgi:hypothetical protein